MPSFSASATDADLWDLAAYVGSLARTPIWDMTADDVQAHFASEAARAKANPVKRGETLVNALACTLCHSPLDEERRMLSGLKLAGGLRIRIDPFGDYPTGNLTADKDTGLGNWSDDEIKRTITKGILKDGTRLLPYPMDWASFSTMNDDDLSAIVAYLRTVPPVHNQVPKPRRRFLPLFLAGKFKMLFLGGDPPMTFYAGNAGDAVPR
jgi:mono/diheme cytochrome c family protein